MSLYLAIDAGGTKTACLLADDARILARVSTGTVKLMRVPEPEAASRLQHMLHDVAARANVSLRDITRTCFGLAGITSPAVVAWARQLIPTLVGGELVLCGDEEIALDAAFQGGSGILVIAGTGSNVVGRAATGEIVGAGGWGPILGDEGSGYWIGLEGIRAALRAQDRLASGDTSSRLLQEIQEHWGLHSLGELVALANHRPSPDFAALAPIVARCADGGDSLALGLLERAGKELAEQVMLVWRKMTPEDRELPEHRTIPPIPLAFTGSVLTQIQHVRLAMMNGLKKSPGEFQLRVEPVDALEGALWRARRG